MSGAGSHSKVEGFVFIPIMAMSLTMSTFISQNLGAKEYERAKKGAIFGIVSCAVVAAVIGIMEYIYAPWLVGIFAKAPKAAEFGVIQERTVCLFYFLLAFSHSATGVLRGWQVCDTYGNDAWFLVRVPYCVCDHCNTYCSGI